ncbi:hypothetical protein GCM10010211_32940 [Streptomyces albospinus]|uniref:Transposase n=1 Tax=Streptomyces albospinus TaxID=285515 RepID=A0ABQ2V1Z3_9ACTN|nr:hypothetical protein GCM10010211_32940 [Streptomyces albospinus]
MTGRHGPERGDERADHRRQGSRGGRPTGFDRTRYARGDEVERTMNQLKNYRAPAACSARGAVSAMAPLPRSGSGSAADPPGSPQPKSLGTRASVHREYAWRSWGVNAGSVIRYCR